MNTNEEAETKSPERGEKPIVTTTYSGRTPGQTIIFRTLLPGIFLYLVAYYVFAYQPSVADFYCNGILQMQPKVKKVTPPATTPPAIFREQKQLA
jgi:hypothetical protein